MRAIILLLGVEKLRIGKIPTNFRDTKDYLISYFSRINEIQFDWLCRMPTDWVEDLPEEPNPECQGISSSRFFSELLIIITGSLVLLLFLHLLTCYRKFIFVFANGR